MQSTYESEVPDASSDGLVASIADHMHMLGPIQTLDEYIHYHDQLVEMRRHSSDLIPQRFAMEMAVLLRLNEYDRKIGLPETPMPSAAQDETPMERIVPEEWVG